MRAVIVDRITLCSHTHGDALRAVSCHNRHEHPRHRRRVGFFPIASPSPNLGAFAQEVCLSVLLMHGLKTIVDLAKPPNFKKNGSRKHGAIEINRKDLVQQRSDRFLRDLDPFRSRQYAARQDTT